MERKGGDQWNGETEEGREGEGSEEGKGKERKGRNDEQMEGRQLWQLHPICNTN